MTKRKANPGKAGRPKGSPNKRTLAMRSELAKTGEMPAEYMLRVMRDEAQPDERRDKMALAAAPYFTPRLSNIDHNPHKLDLTKLTDAELTFLIGLLRAQLAGGAGRTEASSRLIEHQ